MEVVKPFWLVHSAVGAGGKKSGQASSIFSLSVDSEGERLATAGLDCTIRIWSLDDQNAKSRLLAIMSRHTGAVLCIRWSPKIGPDSKCLLASGSDDTIILIWEKNESGYANAAFDAAAAGITADGNIPTESYSVLYRLQGHSTDVNGLEWSPDGKCLASCGLDGRIIIWQADAAFSQLKTLETESKKPLKGLAWDPLGKFLAAETDDGTSFIWNTVNWKLETCITASFAEAAESYTYFSRPCWSPDGKVLCVPDINNQSEPVAILVERNQWNTDTSLVGHISSITSVKFYPKIFKKDSTIFYIVAMGSQDGAVSFWSSIETRPLAVIGGVFDHAVMDLAWLPNGNTLVASNYDGTVAMFSVSFDLFKGEIISEDEQKDILSSLQKELKSTLNLPTSVDQINLLEEINKVSPVTAGMVTTKNESSSEIPVKDKSNEPSSLDNPKITASSVSPQIENRLKDGKRRITPQFLQATSSIKTITAPAMISVSESYSVIIGKPSRRNWLKAPQITKSMVVPVSKEVNCDKFEISIMAEQCKISRVSSMDQVIRWRDTADGRVNCVSVCKNEVLAFTTTKQKLSLISGHGRRLIPDMLLSANACILGSDDDILCAVLETGLFYVWQIPEIICVVSDEIPSKNLYTDLTDIEVRKLSNGQFTIHFHFAHGESLLYSSQAKSFFSVEGPNHIDEVIRSVWGEEIAACDPAFINKLVKLEDEDIRKQSVSYIEGNIAAMRISGDNVRIIPWIIAYARRLSFDNEEEKAVEFIRTLPESDNNLKKALAACFVESSSPIIKNLADETLQDLQLKM